MVLKEEFWRPTFISVKISRPRLDKDEGIKRIQSLIKLKLDETEQIPGWRVLPPFVVNAIRHVIIRVAFGAYKIGLLLG